MSDVLVIKETVEEGVDPCFYARVVDAFGVVLTIADVTTSGVSLRVYDLSAPGSSIPPITGLDPATTYSGHALMYNTLQTSPGWERDNDGFNFIYLFSWGSLPTNSYGAHVLRFEFTFNLEDGGIARANFECRVRSQLS